VWQQRRIAAYGVAFDEAGRVLLVHASDGDYWGLPGGGVRHGEAPRRALVREFDEETGLALSVVALREVHSDLALHRDGSAVVHTDRVIYDVRVAAGTLRSEPSGTSDRAEWVDPEQLAGLELMPYVARVLEQPGPGPGEIPTAVPRTGTAPDRVQRFAAYGLVTDPAGRLLLSRIANGYPGAGRWHLPGGGTDHGEQPTAGLLREIVEETNQRAWPTRLLDVSHYHNPRALGPERRPIAWHTVRALYRAMVEAPTEPKVTEAAGGSTAAAEWFAPGQLAGLRLTEFARDAIDHHLG
jgi:ADP-ribose pyrophosphatase YjhB (NUDIX family)